jgi:hypothetical protein
MVFVFMVLVPQGENFRAAVSKSHTGEQKHRNKIKMAIIYSIDGS